MEFHLCHDKTIIVAMKLIDLESVLTTLDEPTRLVDNAGFAQGEQVFCLVEGDLLLKLITAQAAVETGSLDGQETAVVTETYPDGTPTTTADVALLDVAVAVSLTLIVTTTDKELPFDFQSAHLLISDLGISDEQLMPWPQRKSRK